MGSFARVRSDRMETPRVQFSARATEKSLNRAAPTETRSCECADRRHRHAAARHLYHPQPGRGIHHRRQRPRPHLYRAARISWPVRKRPCRTASQTNRQSRLGIPLPGISGARLQCQEEDDSETFSAITVAGWKSRDRKILTAAPCGLLGTVLGRSSNSRTAGRRRPFVRVLAARRGRVPQSACLRLRCAGNSGIPPFVPWRPRRPARTIRIGSKVARLCMSRSSVRTGSGSKMLWPTATPGCPRPCCWRGRLAANERMLSAGLDSLDWLMETQRCADQLGHFVPIGSQGFLPPG